MSDTQKRVVVVTGGSRGIGRALCEAFSARDTYIYFNYSSSKNSADETLKRINEKGGSGSAIKADVSIESDVSTFFKQVIDEQGQLDVLVNNAGISRDGLIVRMKEADWDDVMNINLKGAFFCSKIAGKQMMKQRHGRMINITSLVGVSGNPGQANYVASKAGLIGLTKSVAKEFAPRNITVNAVAPGYIETDMTSVLPDKAKQAMLEAIPLGRPGTPSDVAEAVLFLASDKASFITGQVLHVNGGMYI